MPIAVVLFASLLYIILVLVGAMIMKAGWNMIRPRPEYIQIRVKPKDIVVEPLGPTTPMGPIIITQPPSPKQTPVQIAQPSTVGSIACPKCLKQVSPELIICPFCGDDLKKLAVCTKCGKDISGDFVNCPYCGTKR